MNDPREERENVLCIGSDALALHFRKQILERQGYRVVTATAGGTGLELFSREKIDVVVLDYDLEGLEAPLVAGQMRKQMPGIPIILLCETPEKLDGARSLVDLVVSESGVEESLTSALRTISPKEKGHDSYDQAKRA